MAAAGAVARDVICARIGADSELPLNAGKGSVPELPDIAVYIEALEKRVVGRVLERIRLVNPFLLRTAVPPIASAEGKRVVALRRIGKRIVLALDGELFLVLHLMVAGRLRWLARNAKPPGRITLATFEFPNGQLVFTEAGTKRRASVHLVHGEAAVEAMDAGGIDVMNVDRAAFATRLKSENHTLKRALTDPRLFSGIGNAYSDEILHRAQLSPVALTSGLDEAGVARLYGAARATLSEWTDRLRAEAGDEFPERVTAFRDGMAVHGRYRQPCPVCGSPVQRIVYAENEANYCARCQTGGRILVDRALSRLLHKSWPRNIDELE
ncbi:MAG TPA: DNA-formamidopyrimidine glycosylase family protein [Burkholderiales bacterium]|nr:DNA-formamidopyrimidine glycosylase family protein [Burkholderiales bacterium]